MKRVKTISRVAGGLLLLILLMVFAMMYQEQRSLSYLKIAKHPGFDHRDYLIKNVQLVPMTVDTVLANQMVHIRDGLIVEIAPQIESSGVPVIDGGNGYLMPGLTDMHVHVWDAQELGLYLANGITSVRNLWGQPMHLRLKESIRKGEILAPDFYTSGPKLTGPDYPGDDNLQLVSVAQAREKVASYKARGYDFIKTYNGLSPELFDAILEECRIQKMDIAAHPTAAIPYTAHLRPEISSVEHTEDIVQQALNYQLDSAGLEAVVVAYASNPTAAHCPTLVVYYSIYRLLTEEGILNSSEVDFMNPLIRMVDSEAQYQRWSVAAKRDSLLADKILAQHRFHLLAVRKLQEAGVNLVAGTDAGIGITPAGISMHQELAFYREAGMSPFEALKTATVNPAKTHAFLANTGTVEVGRKANLVLLQSNPLIDPATLRKPLGVWVGGRYIPREQLEAFTGHARDRKNLLPSALRYAEYLLRER
ncbi:Imidazolonepropionase [Cyclobacterium xiamenense]|uniref:Imidazolonepropionase n=1 Tax=Cyclobacterium xiamenense TaxID=1297121 RepID=A0A1H6Y2P4_9BACT|nr:amidohydrolase family protein [Cyclobacterium xiamenense]SEJ34706.1 Imidazolonepropionase [Cyclobacterium xiamenense]